MNKDQLQQDLLKNIKPGIKPSDLKKKGKNSNGEKALGLSNPLISPSHQKNNTPASSPPISPIIEPIGKSWNSGNNPKEPEPEKDQKIQQLQEQVNFWSQTAQTHLTNLQRATAQLDQAEEQIKELQNQPNQLSQEIETALKEANQKIREQEKTIQSLQNQTKTPTNTKLPTFTCSDCQQTKTHQELSRQFNNFSFCRSCSKKARAVAQGQKPQPSTFTCASCEQTHSGTPTKMKLDKTLQEYPICLACRPTLKEFNEADLITDELWAKYPYSSASEILEKEFGIHKEEPW